MSWYRARQAESASGNDLHRLRLAFLPAGSGYDSLQIHRPCQPRVPAAGRPPIPFSHKKSYVPFNDQLLIPLGNRLQKIDRHRRKLARRQELDCFRVYDFDLPEFPLAIDRYGDQLYIAVYQNKGPQWLVGLDDLTGWLEWLLPVVRERLQVEPESVHVKYRRRKSDTQDQYQKTGGKGQFFEVQESGLRFLVNLTDYLDTGLFLDHRDTRTLVRQGSNGKRVLNLFCYTGSFSVYAADGNASLVTSVDLSNTYLDWAAENFKRNGLLDPGRHGFVKADVLGWLKEQPKASYDLVVMDPPTFSNSKSMDSHLDIQRDHVEMIQDALNLLTDGGTLYFSTNSRRFQMDSAGFANATVRDITKQTTPFDFEGKMHRWCYRIAKNLPGS